MLEKLFLMQEIYKSKTVNVSDTELVNISYIDVSHYLQHVKNIPADPQKLPKSMVTLEENEDYHITIQSIKYGQILSEKSFQTRKS